MAARGEQKGHHMTLLSAVDIGNVALPAAQALGRILVVVIASIAAMRIARLLIGRVDDNRFREQLMFFVPKIVAVIVGVVGLSVIGIDVSGMAAIMATVGVTGAVVFTPVGQNFVAGAMIRIDELLRSSSYQTRMLLQVHDELVFDLAENEAEELVPKILDLMRKALPLPHDVPVEVEHGTGPNWLAAH